MSVSLDIKKISKEYGIKQSDWNALFNRRPKPYYFYYKEEYDLKNEIKKHNNFFIIYLCIVSGIWYIL